MNAININNSALAIQTTQKMENKIESSTSIKKIEMNDSDHVTAADKVKIDSLTEKLNKFNEIERTNVKFELHEDLHEYYVTIVNTKTDEVIKEIPAKKMLDMYAAMAEHMGFLVDETV